LVVTSLTILASKDIFQIEDFISSSSLNVPTQKFVGIRSDNFVLNVFGKWRRIWKI